MKQLTALIDPSTEFYRVTLRRALKICQYFGSNLHIVSIHSELANDTSLDWTTEILREAANKLIGKEHHTIDITYEVAVGKVVPIISDIITATGSDLLVLGTKNNNLLFQWLYGKEDPVDIAQEVDCPVLLVPPSDFERRIKRIVYTTEFVFEDIAALNVIEDWANIFKSEIVCLHVCKSEADVAEAELKLSAIGERFGSINFQYKIMIGDVVDSITEQIQFGETDLVVGLHKRRSWWAKVLKPSITQEVAVHATVPMLLFKKDTNGSFYP